MTFFGLLSWVVTFVGYLELGWDIGGLFGLIHDPTCDVKLGREPCGLLSLSCDSYWAVVTFAYTSIRVPLCFSSFLRVLVHRLRLPLLTWRVLQIVWCMIVLKTIIYCSKGLNAHLLFWIILFKTLEVCIGLTLPYCNLCFSLSYAHCSLVNYLQKRRSYLRKIFEYNEGLNQLCCSLLLMVYISLVFPIH